METKQEYFTGHIGVDFGSKLAGTTAVCWAKSGKLHIRKSRKHANADQFLMEIVQKLSPQKVFIDAPLSLPPAYFGKGEDFFYREADRLLSAMSPMFLGGLTARAMKLKYMIPEISFFETYPKHLVKQLEITKHYKNHAEAFVSELNSILPYKLDNPKPDWHMIDSVLAWFSGWRFQEKKGLRYGSCEEGAIWV